MMQRYPFLIWLTFPILIGKTLDIFETLALSAIHILESRIHEFYCQISINEILSLSETFANWDYPLVLHF